MRSVHALQQAMVRMLLDPPFADRVYAGPVDGLTEPERALLVKVDPRAWSTDRYRRGRAVHALIDEYPATAAVLGVAGVDAFFSSDALAVVLSDRGSLALDFGTWAADRAGGVALLERAIAAARRAERPPGPGIATAPGVEPLEIDEAVLGFYGRVRERLGATPARTLAEGWTPISPPAPSGVTTHLLVERSEAGEVGIGGASASLVALLTAALEPRPRSDIEATARALGCDEAEAAELVDDLLAEGLLVERT